MRNGTILLLGLALGLLIPGSGAKAAAGENKIGLRVTRFTEILPPGGTLRCLFASGRFGYLIRRSPEDLVEIDVINDGVVEGERTRMRAITKDYGTPFMLYLSYFQRTEDFGSYFELLLQKRMDANTGSYKGAVMFTEAYFEKEGEEKEKESLKPISKQWVFCRPE